MAGKNVSGQTPEASVAEQLAGRIVALEAFRLPPAVRQKCQELLIDVVGLCVTAFRRERPDHNLKGETP